MDKTTDQKIFLTLFISLGLTIVLFIASLTQNAYYINDGVDSVGSYGFMALLFGFFGLGGAGISWLANPILVLSLIHLKRNNLRKAQIFGGIALLFGLSFLFFDEIIANEGGGKAPITSYGLGYWLWLSSLIANFVGLVLIGLFSKDTDNSNQH